MPSSLLWAVKVVILTLQCNDVERGVLEAMSAMTHLLIGFVLGFYVCLSVSCLLVLAGRETPR
jgi:hypothetical protein